MRRVCIAVGLNLLCAVFAHADVPTSQPTAPLPFDATRYMHVSEVRPGMKGYGLSVFLGTKIERFDVEVISVLHDFNPKFDVVLIRCHGQGLENTGPIAGMSGSPIFLHDDAGHDRIIGAFAYGWGMQKDPIAGVQPIEYMLNVGHSTPTTAPADPTTRPDVTCFTDGGPSPTHGVEDGVTRWSLSDVLPLLRRSGGSAAAGLDTQRSLAGNGDDAQPRALLTPLETTGLSGRLLEQLAPAFSACGLVPVQAGGGGGQNGNTPAPIEAGSVLALPLLEGDVDMSAVGTCTDRVGDRVLAFGHPFLGEGQAAFPISGGSIQGIIANYNTSFKLGSPDAISGTLTDDQTVGIAGTVGPIPTMIPIDLHVRYSDGSEDQHYHFSCAVHPKLTPLLANAAVTSALTGRHDLPEYHTVDYDLSVRFADGKTVRVHNADVNEAPSDLFGELALPIMGAMENPFERVNVTQINGELTVTPRAREAEILYADVPRSRYRPGQTVRAYVAYRPFHGSERVLPVELELPTDLPDGTYQLSISDWQKYFEDEQADEPFRFTAENIEQVFDVIHDASSIAHRAVYARLLRQADGVAIGHTAMPKLPSSRREILVGAGRSDTTEFTSSVVKITPTDLVMTGSCDFEISIDQNADTDLASTGHLPPRSARPAPRPASPIVPTPHASGHTDEPNPSPTP